MPILDLLASITGEKPAASSAPVSRPTAILPKRKAENELRSAGTKTARTDSMDRSSRSNEDPRKPSPRPVDQFLGASRDRASLASRSSLAKPANNEKPSPAGHKATGTGTSSANGSKSLPSRPLPNRALSTGSAPPKKRSYAEIMARAKANSEHRESLGKIQHKTIERTLTMKERKEMKTEDARKARTASRRAVPGRSSSTLPPLRNGTRAAGPRDGISSASTSTKKAAPTEEKKVKKAALATTGYTGTARPRPGASTTGKAQTANRPSAGAPSRDKPRYGAAPPSSRRKYEEDDEELDDFIDYDEEEEPGYGIPRRYKYDSYEEESDMEAGISDIEDEEVKAERFARREDLEQEALEKRLKREKEEKKRKFLEAAKAKAGNR